MDLHLLALMLMAAQGVLGAFDTLYHHELKVALPQQTSAQTELTIHGLRSVIYSVLFIGLAFWQWHGLWAVVLIALFSIEIGLTLWDFVEEDRSRLLPASERITHTLLAVNGGAFLILLTVVAQQWWQQPSAWVFNSYGALSVFLVICGIGVAVSGLRDTWAAKTLKQINGQPPIMLPIANTMQHVLITGATGFIGQALVKALLTNHQQVTVLTRQPQAAAWLFKGKVRCINYSELNTLPPVDVVINLAGARILGMPWTQKRRAILRNSRVALTTQLVQWMAQTPYKPKLFFSASAVGYYGIQALEDRSALIERSPPQNIFMSQLCQEWEQAAQAATQYGVKVVIMRFGMVLGFGGALPMMLLPVYWGIGGRLGSGQQYLPWIHLQDLLGAIAHFWQSSANLSTLTIANFVAPERVTQHQFVQTAANLVHRPVWFNTPAVLVRRLLGEQSDILLQGQGAIPQQLLDSGFKFEFAYLTDALRNLLCKSKLYSPETSEVHSIT